MKYEHQDVIVGDVLEVLPGLLDESFDVVVADPPYFRVVNEKWDRQWRNLEDYCHWCQQWLSEIPRLLRPNGHLWVWGFFDSLSSIHSQNEENGGGMWSIYTGDNVCAQIPTKRRWLLLCEALEMRIPYEEIELFWNSRMGITNVWDGLSVTDRTHPTQKPDEAIRRIVESSCPPNGQVLDLFAGSLVGRRVCHQLRRKCVSVERDQGYVDVAQKQPSSNLGGLFDLLR